MAENDQAADETILRLELEVPARVLCVTTDELLRSGSCLLIQELLKRQSEEWACRLAIRAIAVERLLPAAHRHPRSKSRKEEQKPELCRQPALPIKQMQQASEPDSSYASGDSFNLGPPGVGKSFRGNERGKITTDCPMWHVS